MTVITQDKYLIRDYGLKIRKILLKNRIIELYDLSRASDLFNASVYPLISIYQKCINTDKTRVRFAKSIIDINNPLDDYYYNQIEWEKNGLIELIKSTDLKIINKIYSNSIRFSDIISKDDIFCGTPRAKDYYEWANGIESKKSASSIKLIVCANLKPYIINHNIKIRTLGKVVNAPFFSNKNKLISMQKWNNFMYTNKILIRGNDNRITAVYDNEPGVFIGIYGIKLTNKMNKYGKFIVSLLNSNLMQFVFNITNPSLKIGGDYFSINSPQILRLPFIKPSKDKLLSINRLYDERIKLNNTNTDNNIDNEIFKLFDLNTKEIKYVLMNKK